jgi:hypothetical protein
LGCRDGEGRIPNFKDSQLALHGESTDILGLSTDDAWISIDIYRYPYISIDICGNPWISMNTHRYP